jgi:DNA-binding SARP family transcriptional activator
MTLFSGCVAAQRRARGSCSFRHIAGPASSDEPHTTIGLLDGFRLAHDDRQVTLPASSQRLLAYLSLHDRPLGRTRVAFTLWSNADETRAFGALRSALWRLRRVAHPLVVTGPQGLALAPGIRVDWRDGIGLANKLLDGDGDWTDVHASQLQGELLPDWYEDWVVLAREQFNELRVHALEALSERNLRAGRHARAIEAGLVAAHAEPLRDSTHRALIRAYVAEGNHAKALDHYRRFARRLRDEVGTRPSDQMDTLVRAIAPL